MHTHFDGPQVIPTVPLAACLLSLARGLVCPAATPQIWTNICRARHRLRAYAWWLHMCTLQVMRIKLPVGCLSCEHLFLHVTSRFHPQPRSLPFLHEGWQRWSVFLQFFSPGTNMLTRVAAGKFEYCETKRNRSDISEKRNEQKIPFMSKPEISRQILLECWKKESTGSCTFRPEDLPLHPS